MIACHKDNNFPEAKTFHPERWLDSEGNFSVNIESSTIVVPFGIGKRTCPGKRFVEMEIVLLLAKVNESANRQINKLNLLIHNFVPFSRF